MIIGAVIATGQPFSFWNVPSFLITIGGTTASLIFAFPAKRLFTIGSVMKKSFELGRDDIKGDIDTLVELSERSRKEGLLALELVSSFYGAFIAYVMFSPMAKRLKTMSSEEESRREVLIEGLAAIQQGKNPKLLREELSAYANIRSDDAQEEEQVNTYRERDMVRQ